MAIVIQGIYEFTIKLEAMHIYNVFCLCWDQCQNEYHLMEAKLKKRKMHPWVHCSENGKWLKKKVDSFGYQVKANGQKGWLIIGHQL